MKNSIILSLILTTVVSLPVFAHNHKNDKKCHTEISKLCPKHENTGCEEHSKCITDHMSKISSKCQDVAKSMIEKVAKFKEVCTADHEKFCSHAKGWKETKACMKEHKSELSDACKTIFEEKHKHSSKHSKHSKKHKEHKSDN